MSKKPAKKKSKTRSAARPARSARVAKAPKSAKPAKKPAPRARTGAPARPPSRPAARPSAAPRPLQRPSARPAPEAPRAVYFRDLAVGDELPVIQKGPIGRVHIAKYAGASGDYGVLHVDEAAARASGMPSVMAHGMLSMAWAGEHVLAWLKGGRLRKLSARFIKIIWPGDTLSFRGRIANLVKEGNACFAELDLRAENHKGELVLRGGATCEVFFSADDEKNPMPPVDLQPWPEPRLTPPPAPPPAARPVAAKTKKPVSKSKPKPKPKSRPKAKAKPKHKKR